MTTAQKTMTTQEVADRLVAMCRKGQILEAQEELFAEEVISTEPAQSIAPLTVGKAQVQEKGRRFAAMIEERHSGFFSDPIVGGNYFSIVCKLDATLKGAGKVVWDEICVFGVKDGKVTSEQFFY